MTMTPRPSRQSWATWLLAMSRHSAPISVSVSGVSRPMDRDVLPDDRLRADAHARRRAVANFRSCGSSADHGAVTDCARCADVDAAFEDDVMAHLGVGAERDVGADHREGADADAGAERAPSHRRSPWGGCLMARHGRPRRRPSPTARRGGPSARGRAPPQEPRKSGSCLSRDIHSLGLHERTCRSAEVLLARTGRPRRRRTGRRARLRRRS